MNKIRINHIQCIHNIRGVRYEKCATEKVVVLEAETAE